MKDFGLNKGLENLRRPDPGYQPHSKIEAAYHKADTSIQRVLDLLAA